ncbi:Copine-8 [Pseudolycoriella hygida]|uniref:Copine-8 n=1 Tax=Pseudolycoriella hygida TaxID=35572 RepID=A0A9Q0RV07_9DIPT|nr:Copine-8 [Pseudolycoriella hygida]
MNEMLAPFLKDVLPTSQVELTLSCRNLIDADIVSKSDPFCVVSMQESGWQSKYYEVAQTETIDNCLNPQWLKKVVVNYNFESVQKLKFEVWDEDSNSADFLGRFETRLSDLVSLSGRQFVGKLTGLPHRDCGEIVIVTEELQNCKQIAHIQFSAENLKRFSWLWNNNPFLVLSRSNEDGSYSVVAKTEMVRWTQNPKWRPIHIRATTLCNGDFDRTVKVDCYDGRNNVIGTCHTSLRTLSSTSDSQLMMNLTNNEGKTNGVLKVEKIYLTEDVSFLDYISNGTQLHFGVAIDFTVSNGVCTNPRSLHYLSNYPNQYEIALRAVGEIIEQYDSAMMFPAFGFGAKIPSTGFQVSHQFPLNDNPAHPYCSGVDDILHHYRKQLQVVTLYGPTNFAPVINNTSAIAREFQDGKHYFVLLIITDGIISDMLHTKHAIINASTLPLSIIIVGVGDADFDSMDELDSDDIRLSINGKYAARDIVQFVPLNKFLTRNGATIRSQAALAKDVLAEIPGQLTSFMKSNGIMPQKMQNSQNASESYPSAPELYPELYAYPISK